jgi:hypothetical protein
VKPSARILRGLSLPRFLAAAALGLVLLISAAIASSAHADFSQIDFEGAAQNQDGTTYSQAAGHPYSLSVRFNIASASSDSFLQANEEIKDVDVEGPAGLIGNPLATATRCTSDQFLATPLKSGFFSLCPPGSQVGTVDLWRAFGPGFTSDFNSQLGLYNLVPPYGSPAAFGLKNGNFFAILIPKLRSGGDYGITVQSHGVLQGFGVTGARVTLWGVPGDPIHDRDRGTTLDAGVVEQGDFYCYNRAETFDTCTNPGGFPAGVEPLAFLTQPSNCSAGPLSTILKVNSWQNPGTVHTRSFNTDTNGNPTAVTGCEKVPFEPRISAAPSSHAADSPTGLDVELSMPTQGLTKPGALANANLKRAVVTLPQGMSVNPSSANGLGACSAAQIGLIEAAPDPRFSEAAARCPDSAKIGTVSLATPLLDHPLEGAVYLGAPDDPAKPGAENPFGTLLSLYITVDDPLTGTVLKLPGRVDADPVSGQLTTTFDDNPQVPFSSFRLHFTAGDRAPLLAPPACGHYEITTRMSSWAAADPDNPTPAEIVTRTSGYDVGTGPGGGACPASGQFGPEFEAGTVLREAGAFSPLIVNASRPDGSEPLTGLRLRLPQGLTGKLAGIPYCPPSGIAQATARSAPGQGALEHASPSCPAASQVGTVDAGAGGGATPYHVTGRAYLSGPYKGAPLSLTVITPAVAGPFDLGVVVVRAALQVDPTSAQITAISDRLPQIIQGIPLKIRSITVNTDRPNFTLNPTSCEPFALAGTLFGAAASRAVSSRFQVGACNALAFKPELSLRLKGATKRSGNPALTATLTYPKVPSANIARASVALPHSEFLDQSHIGTVCTRVQYAADACPARSVYGRARAFSPLLDKPLEGLVYLRSSSNTLPDLVAALKGQIDVDLVGRIDSFNGGIRTTFDSAPDAPVSKFVLEMQGGKKGLLENSRNLCKSTNRATARFTGHNGKSADSRPLVKAVACGGKGKRKRGAR